MDPIVSDVHDHIVYHKIDVSDDVGVFLGRQVVRTLRHELSQNKLVQEHLIKSIEFG